MGDFLTEMQQDILAQLSLENEHFPQAYIDWEQDEWIANEPAI